MINSLFGISFNKILLNLFKLHNLLNLYKK